MHRRDAIRAGRGAAAQHARECYAREHAKRKRERGTEDKCLLHGCFPLWKIQLSFTCWPGNRHGSQTLKTPSAT